MNLPEIANDKLKHFFWGSVLSVPGVAAAFPLFAFIGLWACLLPFALPLGAGVKKELDDLSGKGTPEWMDLAYTVAGGAIGAAGLLIGTLG